MLRSLRRALTRLNRFSKANSKRTAHVQSTPRAVFAVREAASADILTFAVVAACADGWRITFFDCRRAQLWRGADVLLIVVAPDDAALRVN